MARQRPVKNLSKVDRGIRGVIGVLLFALALNSEEMVGWNIASSFLAIYLLLTTFFSWDPIYALLKFRTLPREEARREEEEGYLADRQQIDIGKNLQERERHRPF